MLSAYPVATWVLTREPTVCSIGERKQGALSHVQTRTRLVLDFHLPFMFLALAACCTQ